MVTPTSPPRIKPVGHVDYIHKSHNACWKRHPEDEVRLIFLRGGVVWWCRHRGTRGRAPQREHIRLGDNSWPPPVVVKNSGWRCTESQNKQCCHDRREAPLCGGDASMVFTCCRFGIAEMHAIKVALSDQLLKVDSEVN